MSRKDINIFGTSFLDLLSGALAAVIILFVIVPKMTSEQQQALEELEELEVQVTQLADLMEQLEHSVSEDLYQAIQEQLQQLQQTVDDLRTETERLQAENNRLRQVEQENRDLRQRIEQLERQLEQQQANAQGVSNGRVFGTDAELGVVCMWTEDVDVDLYVKDVSTGKVCYFGARAWPFGNLLEDIRSRTSPDDDRYELFYQKKIVPGTYEVYVNIFSSDYNPWSGVPAHVEGYVVMFPGKSNQQKIDYPRMTLNQSGVRYNIGTLIVTNSTIRLDR